MKTESISGENKLTDKKVLVMAGGTGGHIFPALAVANKLIKQGCKIHWLGTRKGLESTIIPKNNIPISYISISGIRGKSVFSLLFAPIRLFISLIQTLFIFLKVRPNLVLGMGGFVTGPGGVVAWLLRKPLIIHEQNAVLGTTNRLLSTFSTKVLEAFPGTFPKNLKATGVGNPLRDEIILTKSPKLRYNTRKGPINLLVIGGSRGALALNKVVPRAISVDELNDRFNVFHQSGMVGYHDCVEDYKRLKVKNYKVEPFIDNMAGIYEWADLVICRSGALTISEISAVGLASILVPYPHAIDDHQTKNAMHLVDAGGAIMVSQNDLTSNELIAILKSLVDRRVLLEMAEASRKVAKVDASQSVVESCIEVAK